MPKSRIPAISIKGEAASKLIYPDNVTDYCVPPIKFRLQGMRIIAKRRK